MRTKNYTTVHLSMRALIMLLLIALPCNQAFSKTAIKMHTNKGKNLLYIRDTSIVISSDLRYGPKPDTIKIPASDRTFDLYLPGDLSGRDKAPLFLFIHGGGFSGGDKSLKMFCMAIAKAGYAVASINYRLTLKNKSAPGAGCASNMSKGLPANGKFHPLLEEAVSNASYDAAMALRYLSSKAGEYHLDMQNVVVCGGSAGAMTALHLAYISKEKHPPIKAVVDLWGGLENVEEISANTPPVLTLHGDKDEAINIDYGYALQKRMKELGSEKSQLIVLKGKGHAQYQYVTDNKIGDIVSFLKFVIQ